MKRNQRRHFDNKDFVWLKRKYKNRCVRCSKKETPERPLTADHVIPLKMGGPRSIHNIQPLCLECNRAKGSNITDYRHRRFKD